jgi:hypothetical protein
MLNEVRNWFRKKMTSNGWKCFYAPEDEKEYVCSCITCRKNRKKGGNKL